MARPRNRRDVSVPPGSRFFRDRLIAGRLFAPDDGRVAIVHEYLLYRWGLASDADAESALGRTFRLEFRTQAARYVRPDVAPQAGQTARSASGRAGRWIGA